MLLRIAGVTALVASLWQGEFEGAITMRVNAGRGGQTPGGARGGIQEAEYLVRGSSVRVNLAGPTGAMSMLMSGSAKKSWMLLPAQKTYMELSISDSVGAVARNALVGTSIVKTGKRDVVAGVPCEVSRVTTPRDTTDVCLAKGMGRFVNPLGGMGSGAQAPWQRALESDGFPMRVARIDGTVVLEVTKIERRRLAPDLFAIPLDWQKMSMPRRPGG